MTTLKAETSKSDVRQHLHEVSVSDFCNTQLQYEEIQMALFLF